MMIEIRCGNFSNFDAALGRYVECGEKLIVSRDQVGQLVTCKKCHQQIEVPFGVGTSRESSQVSQNAVTKKAFEKPNVASVSNSLDASTTNKPRGRTSQPVGQQKSQPGKSSSTETSARIRKPGQDSLSSKLSENGESHRSSSATKASSKKPASASRSPAARKKRRSPSSDVLKTDVMSMDFSDQPVTSTLGEDRVERCKKCGNIVDSGQCTICKHVEPKFEKLHLPLDEIEIEVAGFQRWFIKTMNEGVSIKVFEYVSHGMLGMLGVLLLSFAVISIVGYGVGPIGGAVILISVCLSAMVYAGLVYKGHQFLRDPDARLTWIQKPFWNLVLILARMMKWQRYDHRLKDRKIIKVHERFFRDHEIMDLEGINICQVLDLQGTGVTDRGLLHLYGLKNLQCVVLKRTNVTHEGVFRLQQSFPRLWIWY